MRWLLTERKTGGEGKSLIELLLDGRFLQVRSTLRHNTAYTASERATTAPMSAAASGTTGSIANTRGTNCRGTGVVSQTETRTELSVTGTDASGSAVWRTDAPGRRGCPSERMRAVRRSPRECGTRQPHVLAPQGTSIAAAPPIAANHLLPAY